MIFSKYLFKYYRKYAFFYIIGILFAVAVDWIQLYIPEFTGQIVDMFSDGVSGDDAARIAQLCLYIVLIGLGMLVGRIGWRFGILSAGRRIEADIRRDMFLKAERLSLSYYHENKTGTIMAWFTTDLETMEESLGFGVIMTVDAVFLLILTLVKMIQLSLPLTVISIIPIILIIIWGALVEKVMSNRWTERQKANDSIWDYSQESFTGIRVIKAFVKENKDILAFSKVAKGSVDCELRFVKTSLLFDVCIEIIIAFVFACILGFGGWFVYAVITGNPITFLGMSTTLKVGELITFTGYFDTLIWPLIALGQIVTMHAKAKASLGRVTNFLNANEEVTNKENSITLKECKGKIEFSNFSFKYPGSENESLSNISLTINPGENIGVVGKIGCGKSTLVNSLLRLYNVDENAIKIDGVNLMDINIQSLRNNIAIVPQDNFLFSDTVENSINFSDESRSIEEAIAAAKLADVDENIQAFSNGYQTISGERGVTLSGGQKQRVSLARAFAKDSPIMILDDSVSAVDLKTEEKILANIAEYRKGKTTIVIASRVSTVSKLDKIIVLNNGELEAFDTPKNLAKTSPTYQKMVFLQRLEAEVEGGK